MKFNLNKKPNFKRNKSVLKLGVRQTTTKCLWGLLIFSLLFAIYKNFTAIDKHTIHENKVIEKQIIDTNQIESLVKEFATEYYSWEQSQESIDKRIKKLNKYLTDDLQNLNIETVRNDIPTSSKVHNVDIWKVKQTNDNQFEIVFSVKQFIIENDEQKTVTSTYSTVVYQDNNNNMIIIKNPTISSTPSKSGFIPKQIESDGTVDSNTINEVNEFLKSFFTLYPNVSSKELSYYVSDNILPLINKEYIFVELVNPVYTMKGDKISVSITVKYLDQDTKITNLSQFNLTLQKQDNWRIVE